MGPAGPQGIQGETGAAGPRGLTGPPGEPIFAPPPPAYGAPPPPAYGAPEPVPLPALPVYEGPAAPPLQPIPVPAGLNPAFGQQQAQQLSAQFGPQQQQQQRPSLPPRPQRPIAGGLFSPFFPNRKREIVKDGKEDWSAVEIVQSLRAPVAEPAQRDWEEEPPEQRENAVYDFTQPDLQYYDAKHTKHAAALLKADKAVIVEKPPLSSEVLKYGELEKVNQAEVEEDIKAAILAIGAEQDRAKQLLSTAPRQPPSAPGQLSAPPPPSSSRPRPVRPRKPPPRPVKGLPRRIPRPALPPRKKEVPRLLL